VSWTCDTCGEPIKSVDGGWLEWKTDLGAIGKKWGFRLVHDASGPYNNRCMYNFKQFPEGEGLGDIQLEQFVGQDGLMTLLEFLSDSPSTADEIIEIIKRIHIDGYDAARRHFNAAVREGVFEPNTKPDFYRQRDIQATLKWAKDNKEG